MASKQITLFNSISFRVPVIIVGIMLIGIGITISYYLRSQNATIVDTKENEIHQEANIIYQAIKNNMLPGEAPIAVELFKDFTRANFAFEIKLYRSNGVTAFSDNSTLERVNKNLKKAMFDPKESFIPYEKIATAEFKKAVMNINDVFVRDIGGENKRVLIYKVLINQPKCSRCHGLNHVIQGVLKISTPVDDVYRKTRNNVILSMVIYGLVVFILTSIIVIFIRLVIISRIIKIGNVVERVGEGDFKTKVAVQYADEIGVLSTRINAMIDGLKERFKLTKFVSKSTLAHVQSDEEILLGGEKKVLTVMFSDIRNFTGFSESRAPEAVMAMLNEVMRMQANIIQKYGGDIDKFVGDELMAVFEGNDMVYRAVRSAEEIRNSMIQTYGSTDTPLAVGIGINTGEMISGNMGSADRIDRTVIGDAVNLGARLVSAAGRNTIILSDYSYRHVKDKVEVNEHDPIRVKGKNKPVKIYTLRKTL
jgi:class 3 adenylate cyclase